MCRVFGNEPDIGREGISEGNIKGPLAAISWLSF